MAELRSVSTSARAHAATRARLEASIRAARAAGLSLRAIASEAGLSHEQVRQICLASDTNEGSANG